MCSESISDLTYVILNLGIFAVFMSRPDSMSDGFLCIQFRVAKVGSGLKKPGIEHGRDDGFCHQSASVCVQAAPWRFSQTRFWVRRVIWVGWGKNSWNGRVENVVSQVHKSSYIFPFAFGGPITSFPDAVSCLDLQTGSSSDTTVMLLETILRFFFTGQIWAPQLAQLNSRLVVKSFGGSVHE